MNMDLRPEGGTPQTRSVLEGNIWQEACQPESRGGSPPPPLLLTGVRHPSQSMFHVNRFIVHIHPRLFIFQKPLFESVLI